jgi:precorrin-8X/cobalt-precorrin-8 methylmutase
MITPRIYAAKADTDGGRLAAPFEPVAAEPGSRIMAESLAIIDCELGPEPADLQERAIVRRMIHASADFDFAATTRYTPGAIEAAIDAFQSGAIVITDVEMLRSGVRRDMADPLGVEVVCGLNDPATLALAAKEGITRSAAGIRRVAARLNPNTVVAVGNAPTALDEVVRLVQEDGWRPRCVIGMPVGFVGVEDAKRRLLAEPRVPSIICLGRKGGTAVAAAAVNALLELAGNGRSP